MEEASRTHDHLLPHRFERRSDNMVAEMEVRSTSGLLCLLGMLLTFIPALLMRDVFMGS